MNFKDLLEHAHLDALGLLDADEQASFEAAFAAAPPAVRAQIRDEQERWSRMESTLPQVEPGPHVREMVIERIREAISADHRRLALHSGGQRRWARTGMVALATTSLAFAAAFFTVNNQNQRLAEEFSRNRALEAPLALFRSGDAMRDVLVSAETVRVAFQPAEETYQGQAALWMHPTWNGEAKLVIKGLASQTGREFRLVTVNAANEIVREVSKFSADGTLSLTEVNVSGLAAGVKLAIIDVAIGQRAGSGQTILTATFVRA